MPRASGVRAFFFFEFSKITYKAFVVVVERTQEMCGFSMMTIRALILRKMINGKHL